MGHRTTREDKTAPRRIHATQEEWTRMRAAADRAGKSVSAYTVDACLRRAARQPPPEMAQAIRLLTASHAALSQLADPEALGTPSLASLELAAQLAAIEEQLTHIAMLIGTLGGPMRGAT